MSETISRKQVGAYFIVVWLGEFLKTHLEVTETSGCPLKVVYTRLFKSVSRVVVIVYVRSVFGICVDSVIP